MKKLLPLFMLVFSTNMTQAQPSDTYIVSVMQSQHIPGLEIAIVKDNKLAWERNFGFADLPNNIHTNINNMFMLASVSKTVTATALMKLWEQGMFNLDDNIENYLPFPVRNPNYPADSITFRMLLAHTSSIYDSISWNDYYNGDSPITLDSIMRNYFTPGGFYYSAGNFYNFAPGNKYRYSNMGASLIGYLVQRISNMPFNQYCQTHIFDSLCMDHTEWKLADIADTTVIARPYSWNGSGYDDNGLYGYPEYPCGELRTTTLSLSRYMYMYLNHGIYDGVRTLNAATVDTMMAQQTFPNATFATNHNGQGLIFYQYYMNNGDTLYGHNGGDWGVSTDMYFSYTNNIGIILLGNGYDFSNLSVDTLLDTLYNYALTMVVPITDTFPTCNMVNGITDTKEQDDVSVYPNPAATDITINISNLRFINYDLRITNIIGEEVYHLNTNFSTLTTIDISKWSRGVYFYQIKGEKETLNGKFVKE